MIPRQMRLRALEKLAQTPTTTTVAPTQKGSKTASQPASSLMPTLSTGWNFLAPSIDSLVKTVDNVILTGTNNKYNFESLFQNGFPTGVDTNYPPPDPTKDVLAFGRLIFNNLLNGGLQYPFTTTLRYHDMRNRVNVLLQSPELQKFQQVKQPGAQLGSIRALLTTMLSSIPNA